MKQFVYQQTLLWANEDNLKQEIHENFSSSTWNLNNFTGKIFERSSTKKLKVFFAAWLTDLILMGIVFCLHLNHCAAFINWDFYVAYS